ncbi:cobalt-precorrin-7 (C(5))-methyltransferase [Haloferax chudinovii]|uniref:Cobalt-precorrin-7 (C(5))-methyltransferase n=1 Tax=Haloferax chudinovii TaxID=1109010 RepID=A0ABD5XFU8_9EURY
MSEGESDPYDLDSGPDPAAFAAAAPEPSIDEIDGGGDDATDSEAADPPVYAVGVGPGNPEYLTPRGRRAIREADVVVGFETVVDFVADETDADLLTCGYADEADALAEFGRRVAAGDRGTAVLMGDPNHSGYQFLGKVQRTVERPVRVIPGISSLQIAASRARTPMEDTRFVTLHKSGSLDADLDRLAEAVGERHLLVLPRPFDWMPGDIAEYLLDSGADPSLDALVLERLTHDDERITRTTLGDLRDSAGGNGPDSTPYSDLSVLAVRAPVDAAD